MLAIVMDSKVLETAPMPEVATDVDGGDGCCNVESIREFTSIFVDICYATSYPFGFTSISKHPPLDILKFLVTTLGNQMENGKHVLLEFPYVPVYEPRNFQKFT